MAFMTGACEEMGIEVVGKIVSMAMIRKEENDVDYNIISRVASELHPGMVFVTSGAAEIGRVDYMKRTGRELTGDRQEAKMDYCAQGQIALMENYRMFSRPEYSIRQLLVEHQHFNDEAKRENIRRLLLRAAEQNAIPIVNYNDPVSDDEILKMELNSLKQYHEHVVECVDNDETAAVICELVGAKYLVILSSTEGIYRDAADPSTLVTDVLAGTPEALMEKVRVLQKSCSGASRAGAGGARAKLAFAAGPALKGVTVIIGHARHGINALLSGTVPHTRIGVV
jgi:glutamate 5-kinase